MHIGQYAGAGHKEKVETGSLSGGSRENQRLLGMEGSLSPNPPLCRTENVSGESQDLPKVICQVGGKARTGPKSFDSQGSDGPILPLKKQLFYLNPKSSNSVLPRRSSSLQTTPAPQPLCRG